MAKIAPPAASPTASAGWCTRRATATPMIADTVLPPMTAQGCDNGLAGTANSSTADAPIGAIRIGRVVPTAENRAQTSHVSMMPISAPAQAIARSRRLAPARIGAKRRRAGAGAWFIDDPVRQLGWGAWAAAGCDVNMARPRR